MVVWVIARQDKSNAKTVVGLAALVNIGSEKPQGCQNALSYKRQLP